MKGHIGICVRLGQTAIFEFSESTAISKPRAVRRGEGQANSALFES